MPSTGQGKGVTTEEKLNRLRGEYFYNSRGLATPRQDKDSWGGAGGHAPGMGSSGLGVMQCLFEEGGGTRSGHEVKLRLSCTLGAENLCGSAAESQSLWVESPSKGQPAPELGCTNASGHWTVGMGATYQTEGEVRLGWELGVDAV